MPSSGFERPSGRRPLVLIGAMNGHGKTSLLFSLYVGLFGRFGLRHAEGFSLFDGEERSSLQRGNQEIPAFDRACRRADVCRACLHTNCKRRPNARNTDHTTMVLHFDGIAPQRRCIRDT